eukprot:4452595-Prymnesium_polylepis.1
MELDASQCTVSFIQPAMLGDAGSHGQSARKMAIGTTRYNILRELHTLTLQARDGCESECDERVSACGSRLLSSPRAAGGRCQ